MVWVVRLTEGSRKETSTCQTGEGIEGLTVVDSHHCLRTLERHAGYIHVDHIPRNHNESNG